MALSRFWLPMLLAGSLTAGSAAATEPVCDMRLAGTLPVEVIDNIPVVMGQVNGRDLGILVDTGASTSMMPRVTVEQLGLEQYNTDRLKAVGIGGESKVLFARVETLKMGDFVARDLRLPVVDAMPVGEGLGLLLGADTLLRYDLEFDLKNNVIKLFDIIDCRNMARAYWTQDYLLAELESVSNERIELKAKVNGEEITAILDSGASSTILSLQAARAVGLEPGSPGVTEAESFVGIGAESMRSWVGTLKTFELGDQTIKNARVRIADFAENATREKVGDTRVARKAQGRKRMIIGADWLKAHRVFIARDQKLVYFTYQGGPVFRTTGTASTGQVPAPAQ